MTASKWMPCAAAAALLVATGCSSSGGDGGEPPAAFTQADLTGEWDMLMLSTNSSQGWSFVHFSLDATGQIEALAYLDDEGVTALPTVDARMTVEADGTVRLAGAAATPSFHGTMTRAKTLVFATDEEGSPAAVRRRLWVMRKRVPGVSYSAADLASFPFALHAIYAGPGFRWVRGSGSIDAGALTMTDQLTSTGDTTVKSEATALAIDAAGVVTNPVGVLVGVMAPDKSAIFGLDTTGDLEHEPGLLVMQRTGHAFTLADLAGDYRAHLLASGADTAASYWTRGTITIDGAGLLTFTTFQGSNGSTALPAPRQLALSPEGLITLVDDATYHGQLSSGADWYVRTGSAATVPVMAFVTR